MTVHVSSSCAIHGQSKQGKAGRSGNRDRMHESTCQLQASEDVDCFAGGQKLLEAYARLQQLRGLPTVAPASISPALQQTSKA